MRRIIGELHAAVRIKASFVSSSCLAVVDKQIHTFFAVKHSLLRGQGVILQISAVLDSKGIVRHVFARNFDSCRLFVEFGGIVDRTDDPVQNKAR